MSAECTPPEELEELQERLVDEIRSAFADVRRIGDFTLQVVSWYDQHGRKEWVSDDEYAELNQARAAEDKDWQELDDETIAACGYGLGHLEPGNLRFYLPAFMIWTVKNFEDDPYSISALSTIGNLSPDTHDPEHIAWHYQRIIIFNAEQKLAIVHFLEHILARAEELNDPGHVRRISRALSH